MTKEKDTALEQGNQTDQGETPQDKAAAEADKKSGEQPAAGEKPHRDEGAEQQLNQERANTRRVREALEEAQAENEQLVEQLESTRGELGELRSQLKEHLTAKEYKDLADLDPESTDVPDLVKAFQGATAKIRKLEESNEKLSGFIAEQQNRQRTEQATNVRRQQEEELYGACDEEFGAQYRNEAIKLADSWVQDQKVDAPKTWVQGYRLMRKAYAEVATKHKTKDEPHKKHVPTDTGLRGLSVTEIEDLEEFKPGTLDQVKADMAKKMKAGTYNPKAFASSP